MQETEDTKPAETWCLYCDKAGHQTHKCWSTQAINTPEQRELARLCDCAATIATLRAEVEGLRADAERYRWLRDSHPADGTLWVAMGLPYSPAGVACWRHETLDAAIDAAKADKDGTKA